MYKCMYIYIYVYVYVHICIYSVGQKKRSTLFFSNNFSNTNRIELLSIDTKISLKFRFDEDFHLKKIYFFIGNLRILEFPKKTLCKCRKLLSINNTSKRGNMPTVNLLNIIL